MKTKPTVETKLKVTQAFSAPHSASRARGNFSIGDLLVLQEGSEPSGQLRFVRVNGLRPNRGRESYYLIEADELHEKTQAV